MSGDTEKAQRFKKANSSSPVVSGSAKRAKAGGAYYTLKNGDRFSLTKAECIFIGYPRWDI